MAFKKKIKGTLKRAELYVIKNNFTSPQKDFFIYQVLPLSEEAKAVMKRHPKYNTWSVFTGVELSLQSEVTVDINVVEKQGQDTYEVYNVHLDYPKTPSAQWDYLEKATKNKKTIFQIITKTFGENVLILDEITTNYKDVSLKVFATLNKDGSSEQKVNRVKLQLAELKEYLSRNQATALFINSLPTDVSDLLTTSESEKLASIIEGNPIKSAEQWLQDPWIALKIDGFGFLTVDKIREKLEFLYPNNPNYGKKNTKRIAWGAFYITEKEIISQGHTWIGIKEFQKMIVSGLGIEKESFESFINTDRFDTNIVKMLGDNNICIENNRVTTLQLFNSEKKIFDNLMKNYYLQKPQEFDNKLSEFKEDLISRGFGLTDEQLEVFDSIATNKFTMLVGPGGTGKTWTVAKLVEFVKTKLNWDVLLTAPTGKAATVLTGYVKENFQGNMNFKAKTLHSALGIQKGKAPSNLVVGKKLVLIDEFSMTDSVLMAQVFDGLKHNKDYRLVFIGDEFQLPSVGPGNLLHLFIKRFSHQIKTVKLTKVFRTESGGIIDLCNNLRNGKFPYPSNDNLPFTSGKDLIMQNCTSAEKIKERVLTAYKKMINQGISAADIMVLTPKNKSVTGQVELNSEIQKILQSSQIEGNENKITYKLYGKEVNLYDGDMVMFLNNDEFFAVDTFDDLFEDGEMNTSNLKTESIANGEIGLILDCDPEMGVVIELPGHDNFVFVSVDNISTLNLGYAYTIHKSQGSQAKYGIIALDNSDTFMLNANLMYTGASRFQEKLYLFGNWRTINTKVKSFINQSRRTLLEVWKDDNDIFF